MDIEKDKRDVALLDEAIGQWEKRLERFKNGNLAWNINGEGCPLCRDINSCEDCPVAKKLMRLDVVTHPFITLFLSLTTADKTILFQTVFSDTPKPKSTF